jgi:hypothetical protein
VAQPSEPALVLLATDAYGPGCRRLHCFEAAETAARFVKFWYPYRSDDSILGFWLLGAEPLPVDKAEWEAAVLIVVRDSLKGIVYAFSQPDMNSAREFLREEIGYGLDPAAVLLSWAVPVLIETDFRGDTVVFPPALPDGVTAGNPAISALDERGMATASAPWGPRPGQDRSAW